VSGELPVSNAAHHELVTAAAGGDDAALEAIFRLYHRRVYRFGLRACRDPFDADDAVQEAFVKLAQRPDVLADRGALSWLMTLVRNACLRLLRPMLRERRTLGERVDPEQTESDALEGEAALQRWQLVQEVHGAVAELERPYREVLVLRDIEGLSGEATCAALGLETAAMKTRLHRARSLLREKLARALAGGLR
jgi:RNA polymerase sigma-70 factor (ECF subfamily)